MSRRPLPPNRRRLPISTRVTMRTLEQIDGLIEQGKFRSTSEVLDAALDTFFKVNACRSMMESPDKAEEFRVKMQSVIEQESYTEWMQTLSREQMTGLIGMLQMARDGQWETAKLR